MLAELHEAAKTADAVKKTGRGTDITTGYGTFGPHFDIQWAPAQETPT